MNKLIAINLIVDALFAILVLYYEISYDGDTPISALLWLWTTWIVLFGLLTTGIYLLFV